MRMRRFTVILMMIVLSAYLLAGCDDKAGQGSSASDTEATEAVKVGKFAPTTNITYSAGTDSNWSYGNQRKEFPSDMACYVRIGCTMITDKGNEVNDEIIVTYTFTGVDNCGISSSDGIVEQVETGDSNVVQFKKTLVAAKAEKATEDVVIFRYEPKGEGSVKLEVTYDDRVDTKYDQLNTIYFSSDAELSEKELDAIDQSGYKPESEADDIKNQTH